jgi:hypothetical protein
MKSVRQIIKEEVDKMGTAYHVTRRKNLPSIFSNGLEARVPEDYGDAGDTKAVYLFKTIEDAKNALYQWMGERIEDWEEETGEEYDEVLLQVDLSKIDPFDIMDSVDYEWTVITDIPPEAISKEVLSI